MARRALILLDGIDEGGVARERIERHVAEVLAPQGHLLLCTSRPAGLNEERFAAFGKLRLAPLTESQQEAVVSSRLGGIGAAALLPYLRERVPRPWLIPQKALQTGASTPRRKLRPCGAAFCDLLSA